MSEYRLRDGDQPLPSPGKTPVHATLMDTLRVLRDPVADQLADFVGQRLELGIDRYGRQLETDNGRNPIRDLREELADGLVYALQAKLEGRDVDDIMSLLLMATLALETMIHAGELTCE